MKKFTTEYQKHKENIDKAQAAFDKKPNRKTATKLSALKNQKWKQVDMLTPNALKEINAKHDLEMQLLTQLLKNIIAERGVNEVSRIDAARFVQTFLPKVKTIKQDK